MRNMLTIAKGSATSVLFASLLCACGASSDAQKAVSDTLKDPNSAKWGDFERLGDMACLGVNERDGAGGYTGESAFLLKHVDGRWEVTGDTDDSQERCVELITLEAGRSDNFAITETHTPVATVSPQVATVSPQVATVSAQVANVSPQDCQSRFKADQRTQGASAAYAFKECMENSAFSGSQPSSKEEEALDAAAAAAR